MLFNEILKYTNKDDPDYETLQQAVRLVKDVNIQNNEFVGRHAKQKRKIELNSLVSSQVNLMKPHRKLLDEYHSLHYTDIKTK